MLTYSLLFFVLIAYLSKESLKLKWISIYTLSMGCVLSLSFIGCKELQDLNLEELEGFEELLENTCEEDAQRLNAVLETEGNLSADIAEEPPYPMSIIVSQKALNHLFAEVASHSIDPIEISLGELFGFARSL